MVLSDIEQELPVKEQEQLQEGSRAKADPSPRLLKLQQIVLGTSLAPLKRRTVRKVGFLVLVESSDQIQRRS